MLLNAASPVPIPNTPSVLVHYPRPTAADRYDDSGVHKGEMLSRMDAMHRGDRVLPPCDRCRRLHMDCLKNLTACLGCTKKHAKCSWKEVTEQELLDHPHVPSRKDEATGPNADPSKQPEGPPQPVRDEELLGEDDSEDDIRGPSSADRIRPESAREKISASPTPPSKQKNDVPYASLETDDYRTSQGPERFISHNRATDADERPPRENIAQMTSQESTPDLPKTDRREGWERPSERAVAESRT